MNIANQVIGDGTRDSGEQNVAFPRVTSAVIVAWLRRDLLDRLRTGLKAGPVSGTARFPHRLSAGHHEGRGRYPASLSVSRPSRRPGIPPRARPLRQPGTQAASMPPAEESPHTGFVSATANLAPAGQDRIRVLLEAGRDVLTPT
jgi:hypothetical protein